MVFKNKIFKLEIMKESEKIYKEIEYKKGVFAMVCINDENYEENITNEIRKSINDNLDKEIENFLSSDK